MRRIKMKPPISFLKDCENAIESMKSLFENKDEYAVLQAAQDLKTYYNHPLERFDLTEEEEEIDSKVFNLSQKVEKELGIKLLDVSTH